MSVSSDNERKRETLAAELNSTSSDFSFSKHRSICKCNIINGIFTDAGIWSCKCPTKIIINYIGIHAVLESQRNKDLTISNTLELNRLPLELVLY